MLWVQCYELRAGEVNPSKVERCRVYLPYIHDVNRFVRWNIVEDVLRPMFLPSTQRPMHFANKLFQDKDTCEGGGRFTIVAASCFSSIIRE